MQPTVTTTPPLNRRRRRGIIVAAVLATVVVAAAAVLVTVQFTGWPGRKVPVPNSAYSPQPDRNAEWTGSTDGMFPTGYVDQMAATVGYEILPKVADHYSLTGHMAQARAIVDAAAREKRTVKVFEYWDALYMPSVNFTKWGDYMKGFSTDWYLRDAEGQPVPYWGAGRSRTSTEDATPVGFILDLGNPDLQKWTVDTIVSIMKAAPYAGIAFDSANPMIADVARPPVGDGSQTFQTLMCGKASVAGTPCDRLEQWNEGLATTIAMTKAALNPMGDEVLYNGIAPNKARGDSRNLDLLQDADIATNESFCYQKPLNQDRNLFQSLSDDMKIMKDAATSGKKIFQITNYDVSSNEKYGTFCQAAFLAGWQPGSSYWIYHKDYTWESGDSLPVLPEQNLDVGQPTGQASELADEAYQRSFTHGMIAVNAGDNDTKVTVPTAMVEFADGKIVGRYAAGTTLDLPSRTGRLMLSATWLASHS